MASSGPSLYTANYQQERMGYQITSNVTDSPSNEFKVHQNVRNCSTSTSPRTIISNNSDGNLVVSAGTTTSGAASSMLEMEINGNLKERRQKRLERNRESARLSRQKRKHFLEGLEDNVCSLSEAMDKGRKQHVTDAVTAIQKLREKRLNLIDQELQQNTALSHVWGQDHAFSLFSCLSRSSDELRIASMFQKEQLKSMVIPFNVKFILWLTLQNDHYYRGGRAIGEKMSASRIGEKMLHGGNDCVAPSSGMWPLLCHEVSLSYDQEERMRNFQRSMLSTQSSWIERHTVFASSKLIDSLGNSMNGVPEMLRRREARVYEGLTAVQKLKFLSWANKNKKKISNIAAKLNSSSSMSNVAEGNNQQDCTSSVKNATSPNYHNAANLYILDRLLQKRVLQKLPVNTSLPTLSSNTLKKLGCRPFFESLSNVGKENIISSDSSITSLSSSGSLKRPSSYISTNDNMDHSPHSINSGAPVNQQNAQVSISPEVAQANAAAYVAQLLQPAGIIPYSMRQAPPCAVVNTMPPPSSLLPPPPTPTGGSYYQPEYVTSKSIPVMRHNNYLPPQQQHHQHKPYQPPNVIDMSDITPYPVYCNPAPSSAPVQAPTHPNAYQQQHHYPHPHNPQTMLPPIQQRQGFPMKSVPEEPEVIPVTNNMAITPHHVHTHSTTDFLLDLAEDWTIEGFDIEY